VSKRILISLDQLYRAQPGGIGTYVRGLIQGLREVATAEEEILGLVPKGGLDSSGLQIPLVEAPVNLRVLNSLWRVAPLGVPKDVDVVHAPTFAGPFAGGREGALHSVVIHDLLWRDAPGITSRRGAKFHESRLRSIVSNDSLHLFATSPPLVERLVDEGVKESRITPIRLGVDDDGVEPVSKTTVRNFLSEHEVEGPFTLYAGTREPRKNLERLIRAHAVAAVREPSLGKLVLVGPAGWGSEYVGGATVIGMVPRDLLKGLLRDARTMAYVPLAEGWGLPPIEALAQGTAVVASSTTPSVAENPEVIRVNPLDIESIIEGLVTSTRESSAATDRRRRQSSVASLTWAQMARDHLKAWR
jgi:glycosyltransferase involved in cell wall biosynthesis